MLIKEFFIKRPDGINLYRSYSDLGMYILQVDTGIKYEDAIDVEGTSHIYEETDELILKEEEGLNVSDN